MPKIYSNMAGAIVLNISPVPELYTRLQNGVERVSHGYEFVGP